MATNAQVTVAEARAALAAAESREHDEQKKKLLAELNETRAGLAKAQAAARWFSTRKQNAEDQLARLQAKGVAGSKIGKLRDEIYKAACQLALLSNSITQLECSVQSYEHRIRAVEPGKIPVEINADGILSFG
ncbi:hypothetical protein SBA1_1030045 [Candidatus Sulfotelmatobacter kueseliae]|uniref:Uncharacterized protein n=1 Tax=Candidatus Sulfotelmatobacter kueseliae TaxID=2042962 RepID=A0A2U3JXK1_9BACT|nr:hypothetical protein SBA1_1030045 [Candidatus Sulfotelmatobacter kueseliae]